MKVLLMDPVEEVYRSQHDRLWRSLLAFTGDAETATEAAAETFSQAIARGNELHSPKGWIWRTGFRVAAGLLADRSARRETPLLDPDQIEHAPQADELYHQALQDPSLMEFIDLLQTLSTQQRTIVILRYAGGLRPAEIAQLLDTSAGTVRVQLHRAHEHLRERIGSS